MTAPEPLTPEWWRDRLYLELQTRNPKYSELRDYLAGDSPFPGVPTDLKDAYRVLIHQSRTNFLPLVTNAVTERLRIVGFRTGENDGATDTEAWDIWQANNLDTQGRRIIDDGAELGDVYLHVGNTPPTDDTPTDTPTTHPRITPFAAESTIVERHPEHPDLRVAGFRTWTDPWFGTEMAQLWHAGQIHRWAKKKGRWDLTAEDTYQGPLPLFDIHLRPKLSAPTVGRSEIAGVLPAQDRIYTSLFNRLLAQWFTAWRQKWATGLEIPKDEDGNDIEPFQSAVDRLLHSENPEAKFGSFDATDVRPIIEALEQDALHIATTTNTPRSYLIPSGQAPSGEAEQAAQVGLVVKCQSRQPDYEAGIEAAVTQARRLQGDAPDGYRAEVVWADPAFRTQAELHDALAKERAALGTPLRVLWEKAGYSPQLIDRFETLLTQEALTRGLAGELDALPTGS